MAFIEVDEPAMLDSTGQDIVDKLDAVKTAVTGLGTTLATDKANRDASNITDASAWRSAIGLNTTNVSNKVTVTSGLTTTRKIVLKYGNVVTVDLALTGNISDGDQIATFDTELYSVTTRRILCIVGDNVTGQITGCAWLNCNNGALTYYGTSSASSQIVVSVTYVI